MQWQTSVDRVELHAELSEHELGGRVLVVLDAVVGVAAVLDLVGLASQRLADDGGGHVVVLADPEVEQLAVRMVGQGFPLGALDLLELVDLGPLAVVGPAEAVGEEGLEPGVRTAVGAASAIGGILQ